MDLIKVPILCCVVRETFVNRYLPQGEDRREGSYLIAGREVEEARNVLGEARIEPPKNLEGSPSKMLRLGL